MKYKVERIFDTSTVQGLKEAERFKARLNNQYSRVTVTPIGLTRTRIIGEHPIGVLPR